MVGVQSLGSEVQRCDYKYSCIPSDHSYYRRGDEAVELAKECGAEHVVMMSPAAESAALVSQMDRCDTGLLLVNTLNTDLSLVNAPNTLLSSIGPLLHYVNTGPLFPVHSQN